MTGVGDKLVAALSEAGFGTLEKVAEADGETLTKIKGLGKTKAQTIIKEAKASLKG